MKIHRLVIVYYVKNGEHIQAVEDTTSLEDALDGLAEPDFCRRQLQQGMIIRQNTVMAGIRIRVTLSPAHAPNRTGLERRAAESRPPQKILASRREPFTGTLEQSRA